MESKYIAVNCTKDEISQYEEKHDIVSYTLGFDERTYHIRVCRKCFNRRHTWIESLKHVILGLILNNVFDPDNIPVFHLDTEKEDDFDLFKFLMNAIYPKTPKEKFENLFNELYNFQAYDGQEIPTDFIIRDKLWRYWYLKNETEFSLYFGAIKNRGYLITTAPEGKGDPEKYSITFEGLNYYIELFNQGYKSTNCFIAMAFQDNTKHIREAIRKAVKETGFDPIFVDELHIENATTINDAIIANLRKSKFCIADFTYQKAGVYFESGFALGQGKPVIFTCESEDFNNVHFDIKPIQHIVWKTTEELTERLKAKIEAWIK